MEQQTNPHDEQNAPLMLEQSVLGAILMDPTLMDEARSYLRKDMFVHPYHRNLYRMLVILHEKGIGIDPTSIASRFQKHLSKAGGIGYMTKLVQSQFRQANFADHVQSMIESNARQKALQLLAEFHPRFADPAQGTFEELLDEFERLTLAIRPKKSERDTGIKNVVDWYEEFVLKSQDPSRAYGLMTGWSELDRLTLGWQRGDLILVGARTSMGKSAFLYENALRISRRGWKVAIFSLEMTRAQIFNRMMSNLAKIAMQSMRVGNVNQGQIEAVSSHLNAISAIHIDDSRAITAEYITSEMRRIKRQEGLDFVGIDYLQEVVEPAAQNDNSGSALHRVTQKIRKAAKDCDCAVMGLSQLKQEIDARNNKRPFTSDLAGSAGLANVADATVLLYRDEYYNHDSTEKGVLEVNVAKQRNGPTGLVKMKYDKDYQRITGKGDDQYGAVQESMALV